MVVLRSGDEQCVRRRDRLLECGDGSRLTGILDILVKEGDVGQIENVDRDPRWCRSGGGPDQAPVQRCAP